MNLTFYIWTVIFLISALCLVLILINAIHMRRFYKDIHAHIAKEKERSDRCVYDEIELVEYTDEECGRNK